MLAELDAKLPPILVHRQTGRVIDGMHRLRAAELRGDATIEVTFYDGGPESAFVHAVEANTKHGLPLNRAERESAAERIIRFFPHWSDRSISKIAGLSAKKISTIRCRVSPDSGRTTAVRIGKDGRARPLDPSAGRLRAAELISARPDASLSEVARSSGIAVGTVRDVRDRLRRGEDPIPKAYSKNAPEEEKPAASVERRIAAAAEALQAKLESAGALQALERDPSLRLSVTGRRILRLIGATHSMSAHLNGLVDFLPSHCTNVVADLARNCAETWELLAGELEKRGDDQLEANG
ncbi:ParB/RepB/Spo0J family partition protein [Amycolatopsis sp. CA-128772]|uniref:ParB/RepB/Spo0J family partition protein n=1 Tax=Amycolatopsis sp. CA-128772 TaxID=2073159 RepID=UPI000CD1F10D|nr:ParB/RepB/Spo0J family partition protein [Amycolatopsis sp. CA-128772]